MSTTAVSDSDAIRVAISEALRGSQLGLELCADFSALLELSTKNAAGFCLRPQWRMAGHFSPSADALVIDGSLGTLGLIHVFGSGNDSTPDQLASALEQAVYVRHLLLTDPELGQALPYVVELVIATTPESPVRQQLGELLRRTARENPYAGTIGVNVLFYRGPTERFHHHDLRRAFPWLLRATTDWFKALETPKDDPCDLLDIKLFNYRLPQSRTLKIHPLTGLVHLVHGYNGSGKSSLVEALEFAMQGRIERLGSLDPRTDYDRIIRHRGADKEAFVELSLSGRLPTPRWTVGASDGPPPLAPHCHVTSYRLDQTFMYQLAGLDQAGRAEAFLRAFFPEEADLYRESHRLRTEARKALDEAPGTMRDALKASMTANESLSACIVRQLGILQNSATTTLDRWVADLCLPVPAELLQKLQPLAPALAAPVAQWLANTPLPLSTARSLLLSIDSCLQSAERELPATEQSLRQAQTALTALRQWEARGQSATGESFDDLLNQWLEAISLADLADKQWQAATVTRQAIDAGWEAPKNADFLPPVRGEAEVQRLADLREHWLGRRDECQRKLASSERFHPLEAVSGKRGSQPFLHEAQIAALDKVGLWLLTTQDSSAASVPFGQLVNDAILNNKIVAAGSIHIGGRAGWPDELVSRVKTLLEACQQFRSAIGAETTPGLSLAKGADRLNLLIELEKKHRLAETAATKVQLSFLNKISTAGTGTGLNDALNELMALFTPSRWAYEDLTVLYRAGDDSTTLEIQTASDQVPAELRLNTAELNIFTVALFLLCGCRVSNPLRMLILDDPLQNMDELTVMTLARGLARVVRRLPPGWRLLFFFHGEADLERFRAEIPAAVYSLPWLSPGQDITPIIITHHPKRSRSQFHFQDLQPIAKPPPLWDAPTAPPNLATP